MTRRGRDSGHKMSLYQHIKHFTYAVQDTRRKSFHPCLFRNIRMTTRRHMLVVPLTTETKSGVVFYVRPVISVDFLCSAIAFLWVLRFSFSLKSAYLSSTSTATHRSRKDGYMSTLPECVLWVSNTNGQEKMTERKAKRLNF